VAVEALTPRPASAKEASPGRAWWIEPALTVLCYSAFVIYASWSVFSGTVVAYDPYVSPFFSTWLGFGLIKVPVIGILIPMLAVIPLLLLPQVVLPVILLGPTGLRHPGIEAGPLPRRDAVSLGPQ